MAAPDAKSQITFQYDGGKIVGIDAVVLSTQHSEEISQADLREAVMEEIIKPVLPTEWINASTKYHINNRSFRDRRPDGRLRPDRS